MSEPTEQPIVDAGAELPFGLDYIRRENALERGDADPTLDTKDEKEVVDDKKVVEAKPDDKPAIDKRTREGRKLSIQQEIDQLTTQKHENQREFDAAQLKLTQARAELAEIEAKKSLAGKPAEKENEKETPAAEWKRYSAMPDAPKPDQFPESYEDYLDARADFIATKRFETLMQQHNANSHERARFDAWRDRLEKAKVADPTIATRLTRDTPSTAQMRDFIIDSALGVELALYLSENKPEAQRIATLHPLKVAEELATVVAQLKAQKPHGDAAHSGPASVLAISAAKPPIKPVDGSPVIVDDDAPKDNEPLSAHIKRENARESKEHGVRR